ncbi:serine/threonine protein kinase, partial [filamentous cyanobacterium LEGE 11480]
MNWTEGTVLQAGKYKVIRQIGGGGFSLTYLAEDSFLQRQVVIKAPNQLFERDQDYEKFLRRFQREGQVLAKIKHPNIVQVIEFFQESGMPCLVMEYIKGPTLSEYVRQHGNLPQDKAVEYFRALAQALHLVHQANLVHCDVHPGNVILQDERKPVLIDFGSAKSLQPSTYTVTTTINDNYSAYEQRSGEPRPTLDVYGLAATLYFAVTGERPLAAMDRKLYGDKLKTPKAHRSDLKPWINQAILQGMELEAEDRSASIQAWLGLFHPPQPKTPKPKQSVTKTSTTARSYPQSKARSYPQSKSSLPWSSLGWLAGSYLPMGLIIGLVSTSPVAGA